MLELNVDKDFFTLNKICIDFAIVIQRIKFMLIDIKLRRALKSSIFRLESQALEAGWQQFFDSQDSEDEIVISSVSSS
ncbi:181_t:CDS:2 [Funneliformis caledonium]|uniref:181_t:CDS:1 n=1 Tax=Funneliformis caledonium TaxID=1117310 RepID=A0A9N9E675_9GLOM|nr:181_t:CDS:2 [Funneliformis caledonium]